VPVYVYPVGSGRVAFRATFGLRLACCVVVSLLERWLCGVKAAAVGSAGRGACIQFWHRSFRAVPSSCFHGLGILWRVFCAGSMLCLGKEGFTHPDGCSVTPPMLIVRGAFEGLCWCGIGLSPGVTVLVYYCRSLTVPVVVTAATVFSYTLLRLFDGCFAGFSPWLPQLHPIYCIDIQHKLLRF
jgi:hypothetical protein